MDFWGVMFFSIYDDMVKKIFYFYDSFCCFSKMNICIIYYLVRKVLVNIVNDDV